MELNRRQQCSFALGGLGKNLAYGLVSSYTLFYYNTVLGVNAAFVAALLMAARIFDALNDPLMGLVVARTVSRWGKYKPWLFSGSLLNALVLIAMFSAPAGLSSSSLKCYISATYLLSGITYTLSDIPFWALIPALTRQGEHRERLTIFIRTATGIGAALPIVFTIALVRLIGGGSSVEDYRVGFRVLACLVAGSYFLSTLFMVRQLPLEEDAQQKPASVRELVHALLKNDHALTAALVLVLFLTAVNITPNLGIYLFRYDVKNESQYTLYTILVAAGQFTGMLLFYPRARKTQSKQWCFSAACLLAIGGYLALTVLSWTGHQTLLKLVLPSAAVASGNGLVYILTTVLLSDAVEYGQQRSGCRTESLIASLQTLLAKVSSALAVFISGIGIEMIGLNQNTIAQSEATLFRLRLLFGLPPMLLVAAALLVFFRSRAFRK